MASICPSSYRDGELVALGQADLSQLTERNEPVSQLTLAEVQGLDAGYRFDPGGDGVFPWRGKGLQVLSLADVLAAYPKELIVVKVEEPGFASLAALMQAADATGSRARPSRSWTSSNWQHVAQPGARSSDCQHQRRRCLLTTQRLRMTPFYRPAAPGLILTGTR